MPWVRFTSAFDFKPKPQVTLAYLAGDEKLVTMACAEAAKAAGKGEVIRRTRKEKTDASKDAR